MESANNPESERKQVVSDWARFTAQRLQKSIDKKKVGESGDLRNSILYALVGLAGSVSGVHFTFNFYGKFVDMGVGRGQKIESVKSNRDAYQATGKKGRRPKKWFSKTMYAEVSALQRLMAEKYGEQGARIVKDEITQTLNLSF